jgi:Family of unknown function (DUF6481)
MSPFKDDDLNERLDAAAKAKQAMLEKFRARQRPAAPAAGAPEAAAPESVADGAGKPGRTRESGKTRR